MQADSVYAFELTEAFMILFCRWINDFWWINNMTVCEQANLTTFQLQHADHSTDPHASKKL